MCLDVFLMFKIEGIETSCFLLHFSVPTATDGLEPGSKGPDLDLLLCSISFFLRITQDGLMLVVYVPALHVCADLKTTRNVYLFIANLIIAKHCSHCQWAIDFKCRFHGAKPFTLHDQK